MHPVRGWTENDRDLRRIALKRLFREVAKRVHPDLTLDEEDRSRRGRLMGEANRAYEYGDADRLSAILEEYEVIPESVEESAQTGDLLQIVRSITLKVRLQLTFIERFHNDRMKSQRSLLAQHLLAALSGCELQEDVMNFFEEMQVFLRGGYLHQELLWSTCGFFAVRWWAVCEDYIFDERKRRNNNMLFAGFQDLAVRFSKRDAQAGFKVPTIADLIVFLEDERKLTPT